MNFHRELEQIFRKAIAAVNGRTAVRNFLVSQPRPSPSAIIAIGKAANAMLAGACDMFGSRIPALLITKYGHVLNSEPVPQSTHVIEAGHPEPDQNSLLAGSALLSFIDEQPLSANLLFLISGGASSLVEVLPRGIDLDAFQRTQRWLLGSGLNIQQMNAVRKRMSLIKGGRLAKILNDRGATVLLISDVPNDDPATIGSGCLSAVTENKDVALPKELPPWIKDLVANAPEWPAAEEDCFQNIVHEIVASNSIARSAAANEARAMGFDVREHATIFTGDIDVAATEICSTLNADPDVLHIWGAEPTVRLPPDAGRGGRNLHLALSVAVQISGQRGVSFLAGATDGTDGTTDYAGAVVDGETAGRIGKAGLSASEALKRAESARFFEGIGAGFRTGPTGTNVMDLWFGSTQLGLKK